MGGMHDYVVDGEYIDTQASIAVFLNFVSVNHHVIGNFSCGIVLQAIANMNQAGVEKQQDESRRY